MGSAIGDSDGARDSDDAGTVIESVFGGGATSTGLEHPQVRESMSSSKLRSFRIF